LCGKAKTSAPTLVALETKQFPQRARRWSFSRPKLFSVRETKAAVQQPKKQAENFKEEKEKIFFQAENFTGLNTIDYTDYFHIHNTRYFNRSILLNSLTFSSVLFKLDILSSKIKY
jgi:hypothetical protein